MLNNAQAHGRLDHQRRIFLGLTSVASAAARDGRHDDVATFAQLAARYASGNHPGTFSSPALETLLAGVGAATMPPCEWEVGPRSAAGPRRVLHVLTKAIGVGGHTRYALRWLEHDRGRIHSLALTGQTGDVPGALVAAVTASGGEVRSLGGALAAARGRSLIARAAELRAMASGADVVVVYTHPFDVVPVIALAGARSRPPVLFVNHSDHCFWIGQAAADLVACIREQGRRISIDRRGLPADRCLVLPIPLDPADRLRSRDEAKGELGLSSTAVVLLSVAAAYKYEPIDSVDFLDLVTPVIDTHPEAVLLAIGPRGGRWRDAEGRTGGRIRALGPQPSVQRFYEACDIYLDSHPVSSVTSLLEAASLGSPAMTLCPYDGGQAVLCSEDPGLSGLETRAITPTEYSSILAGLVEDAGLRSDLGTTGAARIGAAHAVNRWRGEVEALYDRLCHAERVDPDQGSDQTGPGTPGPLDEILCRIQSHPVLRPGLFADVYRERDHIPSPLRARGWLNLAVDEAGRTAVPHADLLRDRREDAFLRAAARLNA